MPWSNRSVRATTRKSDGAAHWNFRRRGYDADSQKQQRHRVDGTKVRQIGSTLVTQKENITDDPA
jgi:hypothetical protein